MTEFVSGWAGGCCGLLLGHPFDTVKVRQQALGHTSLAAALQAESEQQQPDNKNLAVNGNHNGNHPAAMSRSLGSSVIRCHT